METLAPLVDLPWRATASRDSVGGDEAVIWIGAPGAAPAGAAVVIAPGEWQPWSAGSLALATFEGEPLPCPGGALPAAGEPREFPGTWLRAAWFMLTREEELASDARDQWECFAGPYSRMHALGVLDRPLLNACASQLARRVAAWAARRDLRIEWIPRWKGGASFAAALTHDVDDVRLYSLRDAWRLLRQARSPGSYAFRGGVAAALRALGHAGKRGDPYWSFDRWAGEEERRGFRSSFYFCPPAPARRHEYDPVYVPRDLVEFDGRRITVAEMMRQLATRGFEIGLHGSYLSHRDADELARQRRQIGEACGVEPGGVRQHFLRFDARETWSAQRRAGFRHDSTLGYNEALGFRAGIAAPFHPWDPAARAPMDMLELPLTVMDGVLFRALALEGAQAARATCDQLDRVAAAGGLAVLLWHPNAADERHFPGWWSCYLAALDHLSARGAWVTSAAEIADWWRDRERRLAGA
jgi:peptidoglycan/xylan/chitin deacetylase (PgdA/CDA1 family)